ncbi:MAG: 3-oxoacyl-[acyl-carrier-protein] synthase III C-terminal domain-containing protein [Bacteriovoracaceae bacterium]
MTKNNVFLHSFSSILPLHQKEQGELVDWTLKAHKKNMELGSSLDLIPEHEKTISKLKRFCLTENQIQKRHFESNDVDELWDQHAIYKLTKESLSGVGILERNLFFKRRSYEVIKEFYQDNTNELVDHLIHVSCTGYVSPSAPQEYFSNIPNAPKITHAYHMGCYASLPAVRMAEAFANAHNEVIDVVHTEMCSLHLDPSLHSPEQMVVQSLFADGHMKYKVSQLPNGLSFKVINVKEKIIPDSLNDMTWIPASFGMQMSLSREVPGKIKSHLVSFLKEMAEESHIDYQRLLQVAFFAVHPGGPKIIESVGDVFNLKLSQVQSSVKILKERGNMSSATLPHVWQDLLNEKIPQGSLVVSFAFGPGLTIFGSIFEVSG